MTTITTPPDASGDAETSSRTGALGIGRDRTVVPWRRRLRRRVLDKLAAFDSAALDAAILRGCYRYLLGALARLARAFPSHDERAPRTSRWEVPR